MYHHLTNFENLFATVYTDKIITFQFSALKLYPVIFNHKKNTLVIFFLQLLCFYNLRLSGSYEAYLIIFNFAAIIYLITR